MEDPNTEHKLMAMRELDERKKSDGIIVHSLSVVTSGWGDRTKPVRAIVETKSGQMHRMTWSEADKDFLKMWPNGDNLLAIQADWE